MKAMISALALARYMVPLLLFTLYFTACFIKNGDPTSISVNSVSDAEKKLAAHTFTGDSPDYPLYVVVNFDLRDLSQPDNDYLRLLEVIGDSGLYADLTLGIAKMGGTTVFTSTPLDEAVKGMDKIVRIWLPFISTSIMADTNGKSPFFFFENLVMVSGSATKITEIGDYAFSSCKSLKLVDTGVLVSSIGRETFWGCKNLEIIYTGSSLEIIGDKAFFDCSALELITMRGTPPALGDSVFLGSTPGRLTFQIEKEHEWLYRTWLAENASKFNNNGADIVFDVRSFN